MRDEVGGDERVIGGNRAEAVEIGGEIGMNKNRKGEKKWK